MNIEASRKQLKFILDSGLAHIIGTGVLNKLVSFIANVFVVRILTREAYGVFGYADNITNFFLLISGLGMINGVMQFGSENRPEDEKNAYFKFALRFGTKFNILLSIGIVIYALFVPVSIQGSKKYILMLSLLPITNYLFTFFCTVLRCQRKNKTYAWVVNLNSITYAVIAILGSYLWQIEGLVVALYVANMLSALSGFCLTGYWKRIRKTSIKLLRSEKRKIISYSSLSCANSAISNLLYLLDVFILGIFVKDADIIAEYKVAMTIPTALLFLPQGVNLFAYPYFAENNTDYNVIKKYTAKLFKKSFLIYALITIILLAFAPQIIGVVWGRKFLCSAPLLRILSLNFFVSATFRINAGNILATLRRVKASMYVSIISGALNVLFDILMISTWGAIGAAIATLLVMCISSLMLLPTMVVAIRKLNTVKC